MVPVVVPAPDPLVSVPLCVAVFDVSAEDGGVIATGKHICPEGSSKLSRSYPA
ncbi:MAG TPA: hypothetical protein VFI73_11725 [Candidatus Nitrosopolaris sp.]|nr:hypothetical protein [Candidatus Nitrosopolaris sp.]